MELLQVTIDRVRRAMPRNPDVMLLCSEAERLMLERDRAPVMVPTEPPPAPVPRPIVRQVAGECPKCAARAAQEAARQRQRRQKQKE